MFKSWICLIWNLIVHLSDNRFKYIYIVFVTNSWEVSSRLLLVKCERSYLFSLVYINIVDLFSFRNLLRILHFGIFSMFCTKFVDFFNLSPFFVAIIVWCWYIWILLYIFLSFANSVSQFIRLFHFRYVFFMFRNNHHNCIGVWTFWELSPILILSN